MDNFGTTLWNLFENIAKFLAFKVLYLKFQDETWANLMQFVKFGIVGFSCTVISYVLNVLVLFALAPWNVFWDFIAANTVAFALSVLWSFYWNNRFVFVEQNGKKRNIGKTLAKTYLSYGFTGIILSNISSWLWIHVFGISKYVAPLINIIINVPLNFMINKFWTFRS